MNRVRAFFVEQLNRLRMASDSEVRSIQPGLLPGHILSDVPSPVPSPVPGDVPSELNKKITVGVTTKSQTYRGSCAEMKAKNEHEEKMIKQVLRENTHL